MISLNTKSTYVNIDAILKGSFDDITKEMILSAQYQGLNMAVLLETINNKIDASNKAHRKHLAICIAHVAFNGNKQTTAMPKYNQQFVEELKAAAIFFDIKKTAVDQKTLTFARIGLVFPLNVLMTRAAMAQACTAVCTPEFEHLKAILGEDIAKAWTENPMYNVFWITNIGSVIPKEARALIQLAILNAIKTSYILTTGEVKKTMTTEGWKAKMQTSWNLCDQQFTSQTFANDYRLKCIEVSHVPGPVYGAKGLEKEDFDKLAKKYISSLAS